MQQCVALHEQWLKNKTPTKRNARWEGGVLDDAYRCARDQLLPPASMHDHQQPPHWLQVACFPFKWYSMSLGACQV